MDHYEELKELLLKAGHLIAPNATEKLRIDNIVTSGEEYGSHPKQVIKNLLSHMHLVLTHGK